MPSQDFGWLPESDVVAIVSYLRTVPPVDHPSKATQIGPPIQMLAELYDLPIDVASRIDHAKVESVPAPEPTAAYGAFVARPCRYCHGEHFSGGRMPGLPASVITPLNLTHDPTGLRDWSFADFDRMMRTGVRKNGMHLAEGVPLHGWDGLDDIEMRALWAYL